MDKIQSVQKVSVIIPAYNVGKYIKNTITSVINQTYKELEIIVVNDGSSDNTESEIKGINDPRIKEINITNHGVSYARNIAIDNATGEYLIFLDGDDLLTPNAIMDLLCSSFDENQLITSEYQLLSEENGKISNPRVIQEYSVEASKALESYGYYNYYDELHLTSACYKLFNNKIIQKFQLRFNEEISYGEDGLFVFEYLLHILSVKYIPNINWIILDRVNSATNSPYNNKWLSAIEATEIMISKISDPKIKTSLSKLCIIKAINIKYSMSLQNFAPKTDISFVNNAMDNHRSDYFSGNIKLFDIFKFYFFRYAPLKFIKAFRKER